MVTLNLTFFIEVGLFLVFLWAVDRLIFRRVLRHLDAREAAMEADEQEAEKASEEAGTLEARYTAELSGARREASRQLDAARLDALRRQHDALAVRRKQADEAVMELARELRQQVDAEREQYDAIVPKLVDTTVEHLGIRRTAT